MRAALRHLLVMALTAALVAGFYASMSDLHADHRWNRSYADASFVLLVLALGIGPLARFVPGAARFLPWRRELGVWCVVAAVVHVVLFAENVYALDFVRFWATAPEGHSAERKLLTTAAAAANWVGLVALVYGLALAVTSNDVAQHVLKGGWKLVQQQSYAFFVLVALHVFLFVVVAYPRILPFATALWIGVGLTILLQAAGFVRGLRSRARTPNK